MSQTTLFDVAQYPATSVAALRHLASLEPGGYPPLKGFVAALRPMVRGGLVEVRPGIGCVIYEVTAAGRAYLK